MRFTAIAVVGLFVLCACSSDESNGTNSGAGATAGAQSGGSGGSHQSGSHSGATAGSAGESGNGGSSGDSGASGSSGNSGVSGSGGIAGSGGSSGNSGNAGTSGSGGNSGSSGNSGSAGNSGSGGSSGNSGNSGSGGTAGNSGTSGSSGTAGNSGSAGGAGTPAGVYFPNGSWIYTDWSNAPVANDSSDITSWMEGFNGPNGFGTGAIQIDFSIVVNEVPAPIAKRAYQVEPDYYYQPDCDYAPIPVPAYGAVEETYGETTDLSVDFSGYNCMIYDNGGDCHMLFHAPYENRLYELYHATIRPDGTFLGGCLAIWDTSLNYPIDGTGRGDQCTSADAAGFPISPMLFSADEIAAGEINHAIRFILPNNMIRQKQYVRPGTHGTNTSGPATSIPYAGHMRLRADYPIETLSPAAQVVAKAMQKYGMFMADGGQIALTAMSDVLTQHKWADVGLDPFSLQDLKASDFEVIDHGPTIDVTYDCTRTEIIEP